MKRATARTVAGASLVAGAALTILGFVTAKGLFPGYSTAEQTISTLGSGRGTPGSRLVFNASMVLAGLLVLVATYSLNQAYRRRLLTAIFGLLGVGIVGVGVFQTDSAASHLLGAFLAFGGLGAAALVVAAWIRGVYGAVSVLLGGLELPAFGLFLAVGGGPFWGSAASSAGSRIWGWCG
ncbi:MAG: DUF998 domain-containing protein [Halodesulfurarchaeum sp.]